MDWMLLIVGGSIVLLCLTQLVGGVLSSLQRRAAERRYWKLQRELLREQIEAVRHSGRADASRSTTGPRPPVAWQGWRQFVVQHLERETADTTSVYLVPRDGLELATFLPGQFLTLRCTLPNQTAPLTRCYSLSAAPHPNRYRITIKNIHDSAPVRGGVSHLINQDWQVGQVVDVRPPAGDFFLDLSHSRPAILLAGGVGITPLMCMIETVLELGAQVDLLLFYGVRNSQEHIFKDRLRQLAHDHDHFNCLTCYSAPLPQDELGKDYQVMGRVNLDLIQRAVPNPDFDFYLCGPGGFMSGLHRQLSGWGVPSTRIHYEAFGPATVAAGSDRGVEGTAPTETKSPATRVRFQRSQKSIEWDSCSSNLLEAGLAAGVPMESGCRAGQCGACQVKVLEGQVEYPDQLPADVAPGHCLPCIAIPLGLVDGAVQGTAQATLGNQEVVLDV